MRIASLTRANGRVRSFTGPLLLIAMMISAACQSSAATPAAAPAKPAATAAPAASAAPAGSPGASAAASPSASPAAAAPSAVSMEPINDPEAERYFAGKTITFNIGYAPGGGADTQARLLAQFLPKYIPGHPQVVVGNVPGGDSLVNAQQTMRKPANGLEWGHFSVGIILQYVTGKTFEGFNPMDPIYLGMVDSGGTPGQLCARTEVVDNLDAFLKSPRKLRLPETSPASNPAPVMEWMKMVGLPIETVYGYGGTSELRAAFDRKETDLVNRCGDADLPTFPHWLTENFATPLLYWDKEPPKTMQPLLAQGKYPTYKHVLDVVNATPTQKAALETYLGLKGVHLHILPPKTPDNIVKVLKQAYGQAIRDPELKTELEKRGQEYNPIEGDELRKRVDVFANSSKEVVETVGKMVQGGN